jgi:Bicoid-interacting protein 3 (Bin3)
MTVSASAGDSARNVNKDEPSSQPSPSCISSAIKRKRTRSNDDNDANTAIDEQQRPVIAVKPCKGEDAHDFEKDTALHFTTAVAVPNPTPDKGHRYGNFHNYYHFHPVTNRTKLLGEMLGRIASEWEKAVADTTTSATTTTVFRYTDVGCNEGDLTIELARLLADRLDSLRSKADDVVVIQGTTTFETAACCSNPCQGPSAAMMSTTPRVTVTGLDLDPILIERAQCKFQDLQQQERSSKIQANFRAVDVLQQGIPEDTLAGATTAPDSFAADMTTLFSTTMWIHIHGGDEGLRRVLRQICESTRYWILLEPQPSKCYGTAATRLRRMGLEPLDVSSDRLQLRPHVEESIAEILAQNQFERVVMDKSDDDYLYGTRSNEEDAVDSCCGVGTSTPLRGEIKTPWNRTLGLFRRVF